MVPLAAAAALGASIAAAQDGEATVSRDYALTGFESVGVVGPHRVIITVGPEFSIHAEGPQQTLDDTEVEIEDGRLEIHPVDDGRWRDRCDHRGESRWECWNDYQPATFRITLPRITKASMVGGGDMSVDRVEGADFAAAIAGSGTLNVAGLRVEDAKFSVAGSGDLVVRGSAQRSKVTIAGLGNLQAREVTSHDATITIAGSGNVALTVEDAARISIVGGGDVDIAGSATCSVSRFGGGRVTCAGSTI
jgi:hypothetical protein